LAAHEEFLLIISQIGIIHHKK